FQSMRACRVGKILYKRIFYFAYKLILMLIIMLHFGRRYPFDGLSKKGFKTKLTVAYNIIIPYGNMILYILIFFYFEIEVLNLKQLGKQKAIWFILYLLIPRQ
ncbi:hypothetical protein L9F63_003594, partial [Diploptera punctata]